MKTVSTLSFVSLGLILSFTFQKQSKIAYCKNKILSEIYIQFIRKQSLFDSNCLYHLKTKKNIISVFTKEKIERIRVNEKFNF